MSNHKRYTEYKTYSQCPFLYGKRFVQGKEMPDNRNMAIGRRVEDEVNTLMDGGIKLVYKGSVPLTGFDEIDAIMFNSMVAAGERGLRTVMDKHGLKSSPQMQKVILSELDYEGEKVPLRCTPDYFWESDKEVVLVDLKTCAKYSSWNEKKALSDPQLNLYSYLLNNIFNKKVFSYYVCVNREDYRVRVLPAASDPSNILSDIYYSWKGIESGEFSDKKIGWYCKGCEYAAECGVDTCQPIATNME